MANEYKCDICGKPATVHITKIIESKKVKIHLCSECAEKMSMDALEIPEQIMPKIKELEEQLIKDVSKASKSGVCPTCGTSFVDVEKGARFGCPDCYETFSDKLPEFLAQMQFGSVHVGKSPKKHADSQTLNPLELLGKAIEQVGKYSELRIKRQKKSNPRNPPSLRARRRPRRKSSKQNRKPMRKASTFCAQSLTKPSARKDTKTLQNSATA